MKPLIPILVVATTSLAVASVQFARQASAQRERADTETALRQKQDARVAQLERDHARLERELASMRTAASDVSPPVQVAAVETRPTAPPKSGARGFVQGDAGFTIVDRNDPNPARPAMGFRGPAFMETAAGRNFMKSRAKSALRRMHEGMGSALGISDEQESQLIDLLADQQSRMSERFRSTALDGQPPRPLDMREVQKQNNTEIAALIGQEKMDDWASYQQSLPDRSQVSMVNQQLSEAGVPEMSESQRSEMLAAVTEERQSRPRPTLTQGMTPEEQFAQSNEWQADYDKAVLDRARSILTSEQYRAYKEFQEFQTEMRKSMPRFNGPGPGALGVTRLVGSSDVAFSSGGPVVISAPAMPVTPPPDR